MTSEKGTDTGSGIGAVKVVGWSPYAYHRGPGYHVVYHRGPGYHVAYHRGPGYHVVVQSPAVSRSLQVLVALPRHQHLVEKAEKKITSVRARVCVYGEGEGGEKGMMRKEDEGGRLYTKKNLFLMEQCVTILPA